MRKRQIGLKKPPRNSKNDDDPDMVECNACWGEGWYQMDKGGGSWEWRVCEGCDGTGREVKHERIGEVRD